MKTKFASAVCAMVIAFLFACFCTGCENGSNEKPSGVYDPSNSDYIIEDWRRENMIFDTEKLFAKKPKYERIEIPALPENMTAIKFEAEGYRGEEHTYPFAVIGKPLTPAPEGGYPAIVLVHGGAGQVYPEWVKYWTDKGYVAIAPDMFGNMLD